VAEEGWPSTDPYVGVWWAYALFCCNSWVWSSVFHARDMRATEALDYLAADSVVAAMLFASLVRTASLTGCDAPCVDHCVMYMQLVLTLKGRRGRTVTAPDVQPCSLRNAHSRVCSFRWRSRLALAAVLS
jgi:hypothetical protein